MAIEPRYIPPQEEVLKEAINARSELSKFVFALEQAKSVGPQLDPREIVRMSEVLSEVRASISNPARW